LSTNLIFLTDFSYLDIPENWRKVKIWSSISN